MQAIAGTEKKPASKIGLPEPGRASESKQDPTFHI